MPLMFFGTLSVTPSSGAVGDSITIDNTGSGFFDTMVVTVDGIAADNIVTVDQQTITCDIPTGVSTGAVDIVVTNPDGETATLAGAFTVEEAAAAAAGGGFFFNFVTAKNCK